MGCAFLECLVEENPPQKWVAFLGLDRLKLKMMLGSAAAKEGFTVQISEGPVFSQVIWRNGLFAICCKKKENCCLRSPLEQVESIASGSLCAVVCWGAMGNALYLYSILPDTGPLASPAAVGTCPRRWRSESVLVAKGMSSQA